jgi:acetyl esterase/lipase
MRTALRPRILAGLATLIPFLSPHPVRGQPAFDAAAEAWWDGWDRQGPALFGRLSRLPPDDFTAAWDEWRDERAAELSALAARHAAAPQRVERETERLRYAWARGRVLYPEIRRQTLRDSTFRVAPSYHDYRRELDLEREDLLELPEYVDFLKSLLFEEARAMREFDPERRRGENQFTRAQWDAAARLIHDSEVLRRVRGEVLLGHLESYTHEGVEPLVEELLDEAPGDLSVRLKEAYDAHLARSPGDLVEVYKSVDGADLEVHVFGLEPESQTSRPAVVWFHGGGWNIGAWWWCPLCSAFGGRDMVRVLVEYRVWGRHGTTAVEAVEDARDALAWVRANADRLGIDTDRIAAAGFSAGGHLAVSLAVLPFEGARPAAAIDVSGPPDATDDPLMRGLVPRDTLEAVSCLVHVRAGQPPILMAFGGEDEWGHKAPAFADAARALGNRVDVHFYPDAGHFFLFEDPGAEADLAGKIDEFLTSVGM